MAVVAGIRFRKAGTVYYFDPTDTWPKPGDHVVVETVRGIELGETVTSSREIPDDKLIAPLKKIIRIATPEDVRRGEECAAKEKDAFSIGLQKIAAHELEMKLVDVEYTFDGSKLIFYFTANGRVDFRDLVKDLASVFKMRIELRQIGVRDEAKMLGGLGACGRALCCGTFLSDFQPVSIRMAKDQNLSLNPTKISGQCGRLMCCLKYEQDYYEVTLKKLPRVGRDIMTPDGIGTVTEIAVIREKVKVRMRQQDDTYDIREYSLDQVCKPGEALPEADEPDDDEIANDLLGEDIPEAFKEEAPVRPAPQQQKKNAPPKPPRQPKPQNQAAAAKEGEQSKEEQPARRRYPRPKGKKQSAEQYIEKNMTGNEEKKAPRHHAEHKSGSNGEKSSES